MNTLIKEIVDSLSGRKFELADELVLQEQLQSYWKALFENIQPEKKLGPKKRVDFFLEGIAIEIKVGGNPMKVLKQLEKYAECEEVSEILLISSKSFSMPKEIKGKPCTVFCLSRAWL